MKRLMNLSLKTLYEKIYEMSSNMARETICAQKTVKRDLKVH